MAGFDLSEVKFLIVDDNTFMRTLIKRILNACGSRNFAEATDGAEAFSIMKSFDPDVVITDYNMQPLDGIDFTKLVRTADDSPNPFVPVIMVTAYTERHRVGAARDAGVTELLVKPLSVRAMLERLENVFYRPRPFVKAKGYFGPDRRRKRTSRWSGAERRSLELKEEEIPADE